MTIDHLEEMFPRELAARLARRPILVLPFGTIEWHSHHLPVGLDGMVAADLGAALAEAADAVLAPVSYWAVGGVPFPYTLNLPIGLIEPLLETVFGQFAGMGFKVIIALTGHFGLDQTLCLKRAAQAVMEKTDARIAPLTEYDLVTDFYTGDHAGIGEASLMQALRPDLVRLGAIAADEPLAGVIGADPRGAATVAYGQKIRTAIAERGAILAQRLLDAESGAEAADYRAALAAGLAAIEATAALRGRYGKDKVPPLTTPDYLAYCQHMAAGRHAEAIALAKRKSDGLASLFAEEGP